MCCTTYQQKLGLIYYTNTNDCWSIVFTTVLITENTIYRNKTTIECMIFISFSHKWNTMYDFGYEYFLFFLILFHDESDLMQ